MAGNTKAYLRLCPKLVFHTQLTVIDSASQGTSAPFHWVHPEDITEDPSLTMGIVSSPCSALDVTIPPDFTSDVAPTPFSTENISPLLALCPTLLPPLAVQMTSLPLLLLHECCFLFWLHGDHHSSLWLHFKQCITPQFCREDRSAAMPGVVCQAF